MQASFSIDVLSATRLIWTKKSVLPVSIFTTTGVIPRLKTSGLSFFPVLLLIDDFA